MSSLRLFDPNGSGSLDDKRHSMGRPNKEKPPTDLFATSGFGEASRRTIRSPYFYANIVYLIYASLILVADAHHDLSKETVNQLFLAAGIVHVVNAAMYCYVWIDAGYSVCNPILIPDYMNILEALLYLTSACMYPYENSPEAPTTSSSSTSSSSPSSSSSSGGADPVLLTIHAIELVAAVVQLVAAIGWVTQWYLTYQRVPGRGYTLDDPDVWANLTLVVPSIIYVVYNIQLQFDPLLYETNFVYVTADKLYMANALLYFTGGLRDVGWFWFMPTGGKFPTFSMGPSAPLLHGEVRS